MTAPRTSSAPLAAIVAALLLAGCEDVPTEAERPPLPQPEGPTQRLEEGLEADTSEGMRLARERQAGSVARQSIYIVQPPPSRKRREPTPAERGEVHRFLRGLVDAANRRDPALCGGYLGVQHLTRTFDAPAAEATRRCRQELASARGRLTYLGIKQLGVQPRDSFSVTFATRGGRKSKRHNFLISRRGDSFRVVSGRSTVI